jgi:branched-chain amino acid transport system ATP-binding protein
MVTLNKAVVVGAIAWDSMLPAASVLRGAPARSNTLDLLGVGAVARKARAEKTAEVSHDSAVSGPVEGICTIRHEPVPAEAFMFEARRVSLRFDGVHALIDVSFGVREGELFSIVGPNGAGKTSMLNCISGRYRPTEGQLIYRGRDISRLKPNARAALGIGRTFQNLALFHHMTVLDNIMVGRHHLLRNNALTGSLYWFTGVQREELAHRRKVEEIIEFLDLQPMRKAVAGTLSYGLRKRVELARAMAMEPGLMLLDEPMAGMNLEEKEDMARYIVDLNEEFGMTVIMIEHDMSVVADISHRAMVLDFGRKIAEGQPADVLADAQVEQAYLGRGHASARDRNSLRVVAGVAS